MAASKATATRTINPLHFEDLEPHRFEDLVRQLAHDFREWRYLEATGRLGDNGGLDIHGIEVVYSDAEQLQDDDEQMNDQQHLVATDERDWRIQCKRYKKIGPALVRTIVAEVVPDESRVPYGLVIAAACDFSAKGIAAFREEAYARGVREAHVWGKAAIEDMLFRPEGDRLLFAYFGISLGGPRRRSRLQEVRSLITIRNKLMRALEAEDLRQTIFKPVLVRDISCSDYPEQDQVADSDCPPWHLAVVEAFDVDGLRVCRYMYDGWEKADKSWDILEESRDVHGAAKAYDPYWLRPVAVEEDRSRRERAEAVQEYVPSDERRLAVREIWLIPFERILEVDARGDSLFEVPHIYARFEGKKGPYTLGPGYVTIGETPYTDNYLFPKNRRELYDDAIRSKAKRRRRKKAGQGGPSWDLLWNDGAPPKPPGES